MRIPDSVKIGGKIYAIQQNVTRFQFGGSNNIDGEIDYEEQEIRLASRGHQTHRVIVFLHEIVHGLLHNAGYNDHNEELVERIAFGLQALMCDNPGIFSEE